MALLFAPRRPSLLTRRHTPKYSICLSHSNLSQADFTPRPSPPPLPKVDNCVETDTSDSLERIQFQSRRQDDSFFTHSCLTLASEGEAEGLVYIYYQLRQQQQEEQRRRRRNVRTTFAIGVKKQATTQYFFLSLLGSAWL